MSEVVRNYTGSGGRIRGRNIAPRGGCLRRVGAVALLVLIALLWITRNSYDAGAFIPAGLRYNVVVTDPVNGIERIAASRVWNTWPDVASRDAILRKLRQNPGVPRWIVNNLLTQRLYLAGNDTHGFTDVLAITHMSRIGSLLERFLTLGPDVSGDSAGGLHLRHIESSGLYYAVRGRVLLVSPDRNMLVRALTLRSADALPEDDRSNLFTEGAEDIRGTIQLVAEDPLGDAFQSVAFAVRVDEDHAYAKCHAAIRESARDRFGPLLNGTTPYSLDEPLPGMIEVSANFGKPLREVWASLGAALQTSWLSASQWQTWESPGADGGAGIARAITGMTGPLGPAIRISCSGFDQNEMMPTPILVGTLGVPTDAVPNLSSLPPAPEGAYPWDAYPRYNADKRIASIPLAGGPSLEPSAALAGHELVFGTSRAAVEKLAQAPLPAVALEDRANLFVRARPEAIAIGAVDALRQFAEVGMLRGYDLATFDEAAKGWVESAARVKEMVVVASGTDESIDAELRILCDTPVEQPRPQSTP